MIRKIILEWFICKKQTMWGRWCLPSFNRNCDQMLKSELADYDNNLCDGKPLKKRQHKKNLKYVDSIM